MIFISYESSARPLAEKIVKQLELLGRTCWYAPRDVLVSYASDIIEAISKCDIFLLLLSGKSSMSKHVLNEIEYAYKFFTKDQLYIVPIKLDNNPISNEMEYYIKRIQSIDAITSSFDEFFGVVVEKINKLVGNSQPSQHTQDPSSILDFKKGNEPRVKNRYYDIDDNYENKRLKAEAEMLFAIENRILDNQLAGRRNLNCLILNTMYAPGVMNRLQREEIENVIGLCYNEKACSAANYEYESDQVKFYNIDVEDADFEEKLSDILKHHRWSGVDLVDITMGIMDWQNPFKVFKTVAHYLNPGAKFFIRDIDDSVVFAYPDERKLFIDFFSFYSGDPLTGSRYGGKRIYSYLKKIGAKEVIIEKAGIDTSAMSIKEKEQMFFCYFGFIPNDYRLALQKSPKNETYHKIVEWCETHYEELEELYFDDNLLFNSGYFIYTASF
jgi:hypothetical protein